MVQSLPKYFTNLQSYCICYAHATDKTSRLFVRYILVLDLFLNLSKFKWISDWVDSLNFVSGSLVWIKILTCVDCVALFIVLITC